MPMTPPGRVSFPHLYTPTKMDTDDASKKPVYSVNLVWKIDPAGGILGIPGIWLSIEQQKQLFVDMQMSAQRQAMESFGCKIGERPGGKGIPLKSPFKFGRDEIAAGKEWYEADDVFIRFTSQRIPGVVDPGRTKLSPETEGEQHGVYAGCFAHVSWGTFMFNKPTNRGVSFGFRNLQKTADGEMMGAAAIDPEEEFEILEQPVNTIPDDDIPF